MLQIPPKIRAQFNIILIQKNIPKSAHTNYRKWLRYYLDFETQGVASSFLAGNPRGRVFILDILKAPQDLGDILTFILSTENSNLKKKAVLPGTMNNSSYLNSVSFHHIKYKIFSNYQNSISQLF